MANRGFAAKLARKAVTRLMDRVGGRLVSGLADTSSDAPDSRFKPKRDLYSKMSENGPSDEESE